MDPRAVSPAAHGEISMAAWLGSKVDRAGLGPVHGIPTSSRRPANPAGGVQDAAEPHALSLSVIICAYTEDRWRDITAAVDSVRRQAGPADQLILVCDHNLSLLRRAKAAFPGITCVPNTGPRGLAGARNTGVAAATGDVVAFLDDDAIAAPHWSARHVAAYEDPNVIGVGGAVIPAWDSGSSPAWFPEEFLWVVGCSYRGLPPGRSTVRNPIGANMSFRRSIFAAAGAFDPAMGRTGQDGGGCEETEFSIRARETHPGGRIVLEPGAVCFHRVPDERATRRYFRRRCRAEGRSKAVVSQLAGADAGLESERSYVSRVLPLAVVRGLAAAARGEVAGAARAWMIVEGLTLTALSYVTLLARLSWSHGGPRSGASAGDPGKAGGGPPVDAPRGSVGAQGSTDRRLAS
jgi:GT2 family glycosyltransferase